MKVAVLTGGSSTERELSLASAKNVCAALEEAGHRTVLLDASSDLVSALRVERPDVCFNALHGKLGEDGTVQSLLEFVGVPFVTSKKVVSLSLVQESVHHISQQILQQLFVQLKLKQTLF